MSTSSSLLRSARHNVRRLPSTASTCLAPKHPVNINSRCLATVNPGHRALPEISFTGSFPRYAPTPSSDPKKPSDERTIKLGKTLRTLQARLPTLLQSPLPQEILSPQITLHLFPSTHPHLPAVSGRVAYSAALWTSPIAWGRMPHIKLSILSERMVKRGSNSVSRPEQLIVRWSTIGKTRGKGTGASYKGIGSKDNVDKITEWLGGGKGEDDSKEFTGLFIFEFDEEGRIVSHTIEHVEEGGNWDKGVGAKVVGLTDWLLGGLKKNGSGAEGTPCPAFWNQEEQEEERRRR